MGDTPKTPRDGQIIIVGLDKDGAVVWSHYDGAPGLKTLPFDDIPPNVVTIETRIIGADGGSGGKLKP